MKSISANARGLWRSLPVMLLGLAAVAGAVRSRMLQARLNEVLAGAFSARLERDSLAQKFRAASLEGRFLKAYGSSTVPIRPLFLEVRDGQGRAVRAEVFAGMPRGLMMYSIDPRCRSCVEAIEAVESALASAHCAEGALAVVLTDSIADVRSLGLRILRPVHAASGPLFDVTPLAFPGTLVVFSPGGALRGWWTAPFDATVRGELATAVADACASGVR